jgi:hypothetical protein
MRCFPHRIGVPHAYTQVDSCNVDIQFGAHIPYAFDPVTARALRGERPSGATVSLNAD